MEMKMILGRAAASFVNRCGGRGGLNTARGHCKGNWHGLHFDPWKSIAFPYRTTIDFPYRVKCFLIFQQLCAF